MTRHAVATTVTALLLSLVTLSGCEMTDNTYFSFWCGDTLCDWEVRDGAIQPAPTWHRSDKGVELVTEGVSISQRIESSSLYQGACIQLNILSDGDATIRLSVDMDDDGVIDREVTFTPERWREHRFALDYTHDASVMRLAVTKVSAGRAVLGKLSAQQLGSGAGSCGMAQRGTFFLD